MKYQKNGNYVAVLLETGDDILGSIGAVCSAEKIQTAIVTGMGGLQRV